MNKHLAKLYRIRVSSCGPAAVFPYIWSLSTELQQKYGSVGETSVLTTYIALQKSQEDENYRFVHMLHFDVLQCM